MEDNAFSAQFRSAHINKKVQVHIIKGTKMTIIDFMDIYASISALTATGITAFVVYHWKQRQLNKVNRAYMKTKLELSRCQLIAHAKATEAK